MYKVGDKVWLSLKNIATDRLSKKLDAKHTKYTVTEVVRSYSYRLDTLLRIYNVFYIRLLKPITTNSLLG